MNKKNNGKKQQEFKIVKDEKKVPVVKQSKRSYCIKV